MGLSAWMWLVTTLAVCQLNPYYCTAPASVAKSLDAAMLCVQSSLKPVITSYCQIDM